ncbi:hypothetical protein P7C71_g3921, partial [Lecanoromycetidae sp. Uapishka_2]
MSTAPKSEMQQDLDGWVARASATAKDPSGITNPTGHAPWSSSFFGCFDPIDTCAITCCCPCITFGKTHHRIHKDASLAGYSVLNASCLGWWAMSCFGFHCVPNLLQRHDIRARSQPQLEGNFVTDFLKQDKEAEHLLASETTQVNLQPGKVEAMAYGPQ